MNLFLVFCMFEMKALYVCMLYVYAFLFPWYKLYSNKPPCSTVWKYPTFNPINHLKNNEIEFQFRDIFDAVSTFKFFFSLVSNFGNYSILIFFPLQYYGLWCTDSWHIILIILNVVYFYYKMKKSSKGWILVSAKCCKCDI